MCTRKSDAIIDRDGFDQLIALLGELGYRTIGPVVRDDAIVRARRGGRLPQTFQRAGTTSRPRAGTASSRKGPGTLRLGRRAGVVEVGVFRPAETVWRASVTDGVMSLQVPPHPERPVAIVGARPCELAALDVLDRVLAGGEVPDDRYTARRARVGHRRRGVRQAVRHLLLHVNGHRSRSARGLRPRPDRATRGKAPVLRAGGQRGRGGAAGAAGPEPRPRRTTAVPARTWWTGPGPAWGAPSRRRGSPSCWAATSSTRDGRRWPSVVCPAGISPWSAPLASAAGTSRT